MKNPEYNAILKELEAIHDAKNTDYATTADPYQNLRGCEALGLPAHIGVLIRMQDKMSRINNFIKNGSYKVKDESYIDTLMDLANYTIFEIALYRQYQKSKKK